MLSNLQVKNTRKILLILIISLGFSYSVYSQTSSFSFSQIASGTEVVGPGRGAEQWMHLAWDNGSGHGVQIPAGNSTPGPNFYTRFAWKDIESDATQGSYSWTEFDRRFHQAMDAHQMFSFGVMPICSGCGSASFIPTYLHKLMQAEPTLKDWYYSADGAWIPNWNSNSYLSRYKALLQAIANHIATTSYKPSWSSVAIPYANVVYYIDIRGYGNYGEWHTYPWMEDGAYPSNAEATATTLQTLIDYNLQIFPNYPNVILMNAYTNTSASFVPSQTSYYALTATNSWGQIGWRRDNFGDPQYSSILENNTETYNGQSLASLITNKYKYAPITGEPLGGITSSYSCGSPYCHLVTEMNLYHVSSFGNGNLASPGSATTQANVVQASRIAGYRIILTGGTMNTALTPGSAFNISLNWQNIGLAPTYENWNVVYELRNSSGGVVWTSNSSFNPKLFLPSTTPTVISQNFTLPATVSSGTYSLFLIIRDPNNYKNPLPLAITGRNTDGSYLLRSNITVGSASNLPPTVNAGTDQTIQLPTSTAKLTGTATDADGTVTSLAWSIVSGPAGSTISSPSSSSTNITGLVQGVYVYRLTATDNKSAKSTDDVQVTVKASGSSNQSPIAKAGTDITINQPASSTTLNGSSSSDPDGSISAYAWTKISGPTQYSLANSSAASTALSNLVLGTYSFRLRVTDNSGATGSDTVLVTVKAANQNPIAKAGTDITITQPASSTTLNGSSSSDPDGSISTYAWTKISGPTQYSLANSSAASTALSNLVLGTYSFRLRVTDNSGATASDTLLVTVKAANQNPIAKAGTDITITQPASSTTLNGSSSSDPDGSISAYAWTKISGPTQYSLANSSAASTALSNLVLGTYSFRLRVTDNSGATASDTILVTVKAANQNPVAKAGTDITITQPASSTTLNGSSSSDPDGSISAYAWTKISGPTQYSLANSSAASTALSNLVLGTYSFRLRVTDNSGATASDTILVTVKAANQNPIAKAGTDITITQPASSTTLNGSSSSDPDGSISAYAWTKISGPTQYSLANSSAASTALSNLVLGTYSFRLRVTDNSGATASDTILVTVKAANQNPVANAGADITITLPTNRANLNGSASNDPNGSITSYAWTKTSGPSQYTIANASSANTSISNLVQGTYNFRLTVTDNAGATDTDNVKVTVNASSTSSQQVGIIEGLSAYDTLSVTIDASPATLIENQVPVAIAGENMTIPLTQASITLDGATSYDPDGSITAYIWKQISGTSVAEIMNEATASTEVIGLVEGSYVFELDVIDNSGALSSAIVMVDVVNPLRLTQGLKIYPNPVSSILTLQYLSDLTGKTAVEIFSSNGALIFSTEYNKDQRLLSRQIDMSKPSKGLYFIKVIQPDGTKLSKSFFRR